jgi:Uma2 family endonuclease
VVWASVPGKKEEQRIDFYLPEDAYPTELRLDLGLKQTATDTIYFKSLHLEYNGKKLHIIGAELGKYFRADENHCKFDPSTGAIVPVVKNGKVEQPSIYPQEIEMGNALKKFATQQ